MTATIRLKRVCDVVLREHPVGCPTCGARELLDEGTFCEGCEVFRCPSCSLWRYFDDGGGDDPACNDCWNRRRVARRVAGKRLSTQLRARRWRRPSAAALEARR